MIGREMNSAFWKSSSKALEISASADASPNCASSTSGWAFWRSATAASDGSTRSLAASSSPGSSKVTSVERPSAAMLPSLPFASGFSTSATCCVPASVATTSSTIAV